TAVGVGNRHADQAERTELAEERGIELGLLVVGLRLWLHLLLHELTNHRPQLFVLVAETDHARTLLLDRGRVAPCPGSIALHRGYLRSSWPTRPRPAARPPIGSGVRARCSTRRRSRTGSFRPSPRAARSSA